MRLVAKLFSLALVALAPLAGFAQVTTFLSDDPQRTVFTNTGTLPARNNFLSSLSFSGTDNLESAPSLFTANPSFSFGVFGTTATTNANFVATDGTPFYPTSPINFAVGNFVSPDQWNFSQPVAALGMYFIQVGDGLNETSFTLTLTNSVTNTSKVVSVNFSGDGTGAANIFQRDTSGPTVTPRADNNVFYFGVIDTGLFDGVTFNKITTVNGQPGGQGADGVIFDDITVGFLVAVPEPSTYAMIGAVLLGGTGVYGRYRMKRQAVANSKFKRSR